MSRHREGGVHQHYAWAYGGVEMVVDVGGVVPGNADRGEQTIEQIGTGAGDLVQDQAATGELGMYGEEPGASRGFQHEIGGCDRSGRAGHEAESDRGGELLERLALLGPAGVGRKGGRGRFLSWGGAGSGCRAGAPRGARNVRGKRMCGPARAAGALFIPLALPAPR